MNDQHKLPVPVALQIAQANARHANEHHDRLSALRIHDRASGGRVCLASASASADALRRRRPSPVHRRPALRTFAVLLAIVLVPKPAYIGDYNAHHNTMPEGGLVP